MAENHHAHTHSHHHDVSGRNLILTAVLNLLITVAEFIGAFLSGSLALMSDATHNFGDSLSVIAAFAANRIGKKEANTRKTFGYKRIEIITALFNAISLIVITAFIIEEAIDRLISPQPIQTNLMLIVAGFGLLANIAGAVLLHNDSKHNLNIKASYLHLISDAFSSVLVIIGALIIQKFQLFWIDTLFSFIIGAFILWNVFFILKNTFHILMQSTPEGIDILEICTEIEKLPEISNVHHVHAWSLDDHHKYLECHICTSMDYKISETKKIVEDIEHIAKEHFGFTHVTLQVEYLPCDDRRIIQ